ncbi:TetR family transcriptional regulator [Luedemannella helvata]|uniref:TetR family transcriptional regulator n=1 Tax=Luedemannella helvata TaxID=349315 RepID=A0ABP4WNT2_9ACTN
MARGRRPGNQDTREAVLAAAREVFADKGYDGASIRAIAAAAGVDPALIHHYFGTKEQLFVAALRSPVNPADVLPGVINGDPDRLGERLIRTLLQVWDSPAGGAAAAMVRSAVTNDTMARMLREFILKRLITRVLAEVVSDPAEAGVRGTLVATQIAGLIMIRYLIKVEPLASAPAEQVVALVGPTIQRYLTGALPTA